MVHGLLRDTVSVREFCPAGVIRIQEWTGAVFCLQAAADGSSRWYFLLTAWKESDMLEWSKIIY